MNAFLADVRHSIRMYLRTPGFRMTALTALAVGIGATTAVFSIVNVLLLKPLGISDPDSLVVLSTKFKSQTNLTLMTVFGSCALLLAAIGIYGLISYTVEQRRQEIGIRLALGAESRHVKGMVVRQGMLVAAVGIVCGVAASLGLTRLMGSLLYDVQATDPSTFVAVCLALGLAAFVACCAPAVKAARVDPIVALRYE